MKITKLASCGILALLSSACLGAPAAEQEPIAIQAQGIQKSDSRKIYAHLMPWFETPGFHWDMVGRHYNPQIGPYHSGDYKVIEYQLLLMKYAGIDGVIIDWPGRSSMYPDLPANAENTEQIIEQTAKFGLEFAVCFEDQYAGDVNDAINSMHWVKDHYFNRPNHVKVNGQPALFVFGPQRIGAGDWPAVLGATGADPMFFTLWYNEKAGGARDGTFAWIYSDGLDGVRNYYGRGDQGEKMPVVYPGFHAAYPDGAPGWGVPYDANGDTFRTLWDMSKGVGQMVQIATWNDYTEGTMIEPTNEFGYRFLTTLQKALGVSYGQAELEAVKLLYDRRKSGDPKADAASQALINLDVPGACAQLGCQASPQGGTGGSVNGSAGSSPNKGGSASSAGTGNTSVAGAPAQGGSSSVAGTGTADGGDSDDDDSDDSGGCSVRPARSRHSAGWLVLAALALAARRSGRRAS
jgi:hypothetical protein